MQLTVVELTIINKLISEEIERTIQPTVDFVQHGIVLITTPIQENGKKKLFLNHAKNIQIQDRLKSGNIEGKSAKMAILGDDFFRLRIEGNSIKLSKVMPGPKLLQVLGLNSNKLGLNSKTEKTPLWWDTIKYDNIGKMPGYLKLEIKNIPNIDWD